MKNNVSFNHALEEYKKKYRNRRHRLLKITKKEVDDFDKKNPTNTKGYLLKDRKWWLIGDTYYEIPKAPRYTWFRNLDCAIQIGICTIGVAVLSTAVTLPIALSSTCKEPNLFVKAPDYVYLGEEINLNNIEVYEKDDNKLVKLSSSDYSISPNKFDNKFDGVQMVTITTKKGNTNQFPVKMLESYEVTEKAFINSFNELSIDNKVLEYEINRYNYEKQYGIERSNESLIKGKTTKNNDKELDEMYEYSKYTVNNAEKISELYRGRGYKSIYDTELKENRLYECPATFTFDKEKKTGKLEYVMDYQLPNNKFTLYGVSDSIIKRKISSDDALEDFNNFVLKDDKTYEYNYTYKIQSRTTEKILNFTFENGKIQKYTSKSLDSYSNGYNKSKADYVVKRIDTTDPFTNVKKLNYRYVATDQKDNKFEKTVKENDGAFDLNLKFFEDYNKDSKKYINEVKEGFYIDLLDDNYLEIVYPENVTVIFDSTDKHKLTVTPTTESKFSKENDYNFTITIKNKTKDPAFNDNNGFLYYINRGYDLFNGIEFKINVE